MSYKQGHYQLNNEFYLAQIIQSYQQSRLQHRSVTSFQRMCSKQSIYALDTCQSGISFPDFAPECVKNDPEYQSCIVGIIPVALLIHLFSVKCMHIIGKSQTSSTQILEQLSTCFNYIKMYIFNKISLSTQLLLTPACFINEVITWQAFPIIFHDSSHTDTVGCICVQISEDEKSHHQTRQLCCLSKS